MSSRRFVIFAAGLLALCATAAIVVYVGAGRAVNLAGFLGRGSQANLQIEDGFQVDVFASGLAGPRFMAVGPDGQLVVAERGGNRLVALPDADGDGRADRLHVIADDLNRPHSIV